MVAWARLVIRVYVIDTSYLLELFAVPRRSDAASTERVRARFAEAIEAGARMVVPTGVVYEVANHIAGVADGGARVRLAGRLRDAVVDSIRAQSPWLITPAEPHDELIANLTAFAGAYAASGVGLSDTQIITTAHHWRRQYGGMKDYAVHIWTRDRALKTHEPDPEPDPFV